MSRRRTGRRSGCCITSSSIVIAAGDATGDYLSRLHYLEEWLSDNDRRGLVNDITRELGGSSVPHVAREMTVGWRHYRYLRNNPKLLGPLGQMERRVSSGPFYHIPKSRVPAIESKLRNGDIIGIVGRDGRRGYATSHVGLAYRDGRRRAAFHACVGAAELRQGARGLAALRAI